MSRAASLLALIATTFITTYDANQQEKPKEGENKEEVKKKELPDSLKPVVKTDIDVLKEGQAKLEGQFNELTGLLKGFITQQKPAEAKKPKKKKVIEVDDDGEEDTTPVVRTISPELDEMKKTIADAQKQLDQVRADQQKQLMALTIQRLMVDLDAATGGEYDPKFLDTTDINSFKASIPVAMKAYADTEQFFFNRFAQQQQQQGRNGVINHQLNQQQQQNQILGNLPANRTGQAQNVQGTNQQQKQVNFVHPQIDGGASYAAVRQSLMGGMISNSFSSNNAQQQNFMQGQNIQNPNQLAYFNQQRQLQQQGQNNQGNQQQQFNNQQQNNQGFAAPLPDKNAIIDTRNLNDGEVNTAMSAAQQSIMSKRNNPRRLAVVGRDGQSVMQGVNPQAAMQTFVDGTTGGGNNGAGVDFNYAYQKAASDDRTPGGLVAR